MDNSMDPNESGSNISSSQMHFLKRKSTPKKVNLDSGFVNVPDPQTSLHESKLTDNGKKELCPVKIDLSSLVDRTKLPSDFRSVPEDSSVRLTPPSPKAPQKDNSIRMDHENKSSDLPKNNDRDLTTPKRAPGPKSIGKDGFAMQLVTEFPFTWEKYLKICPAVIAPAEAFMQTTERLENRFELNMKLEARDPRNSSSWCLATIISREGLRIGLRLDGTDTSNDFYEMIDSSNIRAILSDRFEPLLPPFGFRSNLANYSGFVEKTLMKVGTKLAPPEYFVKPPNRPKSNLFKVGMKLEAIDRKNPFLICPSTVIEVKHDTIRILFDGWSDTYGYTCEYYSRDLFPVNWCRDTYHRLSPPKGWDQLVLTGQPLMDMNRILGSSTPDTPKSTSTKKKGRRSTQSPRNRTTQNRSFETSTKEKKKLGRPRTRSPSTPRHHSPIKKAKVKLSHPKQNSDSPVLIKLDNEEKSPDDNGERIQNTPPPDELIFQCQRIISIDEWRKTKALSATINNKNITSSDVQMPCAQEIDETKVPSSKVNNSCSDETTTDEGQLSEQTSESNASDNGKKDLLEQVMSWTVDDVLNFISKDDALAKWSEAFQENEIDGKAFLLLEPEFLIKFMNIKVGPALKIQKLVDSFKE